MATMFNWEKLSPAEFRQLQEYTSYSNKKLKDALVEFSGNASASSPAKSDEMIDFKRFCEFMNLYLDANVPDELCRHLFLSFLKKPVVVPKTVPVITVREPGSEIDGAVASSDPAVKPADSSVKRSLSLKNSIGNVTANGESSKPPSTSLLDKGLALLRRRSTEINQSQISVRDLVCCLSLLEAGRPEDKLEFMFRLYDTDGNGILDATEIDCIITQMMTVAEYLGWDVTELKPILQDMMHELDYDSDGTVSLEEWKRGGLTNIPLLVLLGLDSKLKEDGSHRWKLKHFNKPAYCNLCLSLLLGVGKQGLRCTLCKYTVHERCVSRAPSHCITTYVKSRTITPFNVFMHHWVEGNCASKCDRCKKYIKAYNRVTGQRCRWCKQTLHNRCAAQVSSECDLGEFRQHILHPSAVCPALLKRGKRDQREEVAVNGTADDSTMSTELGSLQISPMSGSIPLLVFVNSRSGGKQGPRILRKFEYLLNPRQVFNITSDGFGSGLHFFKDLPLLRILCCGGDGTVGWLLDSMDKVKFVKRPPVAVLPLGTGNDLARCLRWGGGYEGDSLKKILRQIQNSTEILLDRWQIEFSTSSSPVPRDEGEETGGGGEAEKRGIKKGEATTPPCNIINNYFSIGVDASIAHRFHVMREKHPEKFNSRMKNKLWYFEFGTSETLRGTCKNLHDNIDIMCDGVALDLTSGPSMEGIALLNIPSIYGGSNLWGDTSRMKKRKTKPDRKDRDRECSSSSMSYTDLAQTIQDVGDRLIEVVGLVNSMHVAQVKGGIQSGIRLAQCSNVVIRTHRQFPMQIDGEPWMQSPGTISITHKNQVTMLMAPHTARKSSLFGFLRR